MRVRTTILITALAAAACKEGSTPPAPRVAARSDKLLLATDPIPGRYLVRLADGLEEADARALAARHGGTFRAWVPAPLNAASLELTADRVEALAADAAVNLVEEDARVRIASLPWNLDRLDQRALPRDAAYAAPTTGAGVHVYVVDTGVLVDHPELAPRADAPASFADGPERGDCNGHGTHVAGVVAGTRLGVAPGAAVHSVRALDCQGVGATSALVLALDWIRAHHASPAVAVVGATAGLSPTLDEAVRKLVEAGVTVVAPAGNDALDACARLPAAVPGVLVAGATTVEDRVLDPSGQGRCVDLFAPGSEIRAASADGGERFLSGTSQAAAHVAGAAALFLEARPSADPETVASALAGNATLGVVGGVAEGTPNRLLYVGFVDPSSVDVTAPTVAITSPTAGAKMAGTVVVSAEADDDAGVSQVAFFADGEYLGADADGTDGYAVAWATERLGNGVHALTARAFDRAGNAGVHEVAVAIDNPGAAAHDGDLGAPVCAAPGPRCTSGALLAGRGPAGPEANAPNTIASSCGDGTGGRYLRDESIEAIEVRNALLGANLAEGAQVDVDVTVWGYTDHARDRVDLHFAADAGAPAWQYLGTRELDGPGLHVVRFTYRLPANPEAPERPQQAVRATIRYGGEAGACTTGPYDDHDDLAFAVEAGAADTLAPTVALTSPVEDANVSGTVPLVATAADVGGGTITRVEFLVDGALVATAAGAGPHTASWNADAATLGEHLLRAVAYDTSGNAHASDAVAVTVVDVTPPSVALELPESGAVVGGVVHVEASASDNRRVTAVEFRAGAAVIGTATSPPWAVDWDTGTGSGPITLVAIARDASTSTTSGSVTIVLDNEPPTGAITSPLAAAAVSGREVPVVVSASDDHAVARVNVFANGVYVDSASPDGSGTQWTLAWNTATLANGPAVLTARVYDVAGNSTETVPVAVLVADATPPEVAWSAPTDPVVRGDVKVAVAATDDGFVEGVAFFADGTPIGTDTFAPYEVSWDSSAFPDGVVTLTARATDRAGNPTEITRDLEIDNTGPAVEIEAPLAGDVHGTVVVRLRATDAHTIERLDVYADDLLLGAAAPVPQEPGVWALAWQTTAFDNRSFTLRVLSKDGLGNTGASEAVVVRVDNETTAEYDAALGAPACAWSAAWCFSGTLLDGAGPGEANAPNTLGGTCADGVSSVYHATESIDALTVESLQGPLASGGAARITVRYWAYAANEADQVDVYHAASARDPTWIHLATLTPVSVGLNEATLDLALPSGPLQVIRANFRFAQPGPSTCSAPAVAPDGPPPADDFGDRDDLVFAVDSPLDGTPPAVAVETPAAGGIVSGDVRVRATVQDDQGIARVELWIDGSRSGTSVQPLPDGRVPARYELVWPAQLATDGAHRIEVKAYDTSGNVASAPPVTVTVSNAPNAAFDGALGVPACAAVESFCDAGALLEGRGSVGPELAAPNTIAASCLDGDAGVYLEDESLEWVKVSSVDGLPLASGKRARVEARVWSWTGWSDDALDLFYASAPGDPHWIRIATVKPAGPGLQTLSAEYVLPPSAWQAVRGRFRYGGLAQPCGNDLYDDADDLAFAADHVPNAAWDAALKVPACAGAAAFCDSGVLLDGRGLLGPEPNAPNTLGGACADGTAGAYHVDASVDGVLVASDDGSLLRAGITARVELRVYASASWADERLELFRTASPAAGSPDWQHVATVFPAREGAQVLYAALPLDAAGPQAIRARLRRAPAWPFLEPAPCGTSQTVDVVDDQDDLAFEVAP